MIGDLTLSNASRIVFLIMDGVGDIPNPDHAYMTPLEAARKPNTLAHAARLDKYGA